MSSCIANDGGWTRNFPETLEAVCALVNYVACVFLLCAEYAARTASDLAYKYSQPTCRLCFVAPLVPSTFNSYLNRNSMTALPDGIFQNLTALTKL